MALSTNQNDQNHKIANQRAHLKHQFENSSESSSLTDTVSAESPAKSDTYLLTYPILHEFGSPQNWEFGEILEVPMTGPYHKIGSFLFFLDQYFFCKIVTVQQNC